MGDALDAIDLGDNFNVTELPTGCGGSHTTLLSMDLDLRAWGGNDVGQLGNGGNETVGDDSDEMGDTLEDIPYDRDPTGAPTSDPTAAPTYFPQPRMCINDDQTCSVWDDEIKCWGLASVADPEADADTDEDEVISTVPIDAFDLGTDFTPSYPVCGGQHTCAVSTEGTARCWGYPKKGALGYGNKEYFSSDTNNGEDVDLGNVTIDDMVCCEHAVPLEILRFLVSH